MSAPRTPAPIIATGFGYPFKNKQGQAITDPHAFYEGLAAVQGGHYLLGRSGFFHGGIHIDRASSAFSLDEGIGCLADGEVVAYRLNRRYPDATPGTAGDGPALRPYSTGFLLVRHRLLAPTPPPPPKPAPIENPMADRRNMGTTLYADEAAYTGTWLPQGTVLTVEIGKFRPGQGLVRVLDTVGEGLPRRGWIDRTWLALDPLAGTGLRAVFGLKERVTTRIVGGGDPDPDKMAAYYANKKEQERPAPLPAPTLTLYSLYMHLADYADYQKHPKWSRPAWWSRPCYRAGEKARDRQAVPPGASGAQPSVGLNIRQEPSGQSPIIGVLPRGACVDVGERSPNGKWARIAQVLEGALDAPVAGSEVPVPARTGWVFLGELEPDAQPPAFDQVVVLATPLPVKQGEVIGYLGEDVPSRAYPIAGQPASRRLLHLELFSGDDVPAYLAASRQWAQQHLPDTQRTLLVLRPGDTLLKEPKGAVAFTLNWAQVIPLAGLDAKEVDGERWRKIAKLSSDQGGEAAGWVKEAGHLAAPWEWPGFDVVDETASASGAWWQDVAAMARFIKKEGPRPKETPFYQALRKLLDTNQDGRIDEEELDAALRSRSKAAHIGRIIVRHDSEWASEPAQRQQQAASTLAELLGVNALKLVHNELPRAQKLPWWDEVAAGAPGFPRSPRVYHFHPGGVAGLLNIPVKALITLQMLQVARPQKDATYYQSILPFLNEYAEAFQINTPLRIAHFLSQVGHESGFVVQSENGNYSARRMREVYGCKGGMRNYEGGRDECRLGRLRDKLWTNEADYAHNPKALLGYVYASRMGNGDEASGDGYTYRGRGIIQLTGKANYTAYTKIHNSKAPSDPQDFVKTPDLITTELRYGIESAFVYWEMVNANTIADGDDVRAVSRAVNGGLNGLPDRQRCLDELKRLIGI